MNSPSLVDWHETAACVFKVKNAWIMETWMSCQPFYLPDSMKSH